MKAVGAALRCAALCCALRAVSCVQRPGWVMQQAARLPTAHLTRSPPNCPRLRPPKQVALPVGGEVIFGDKHLAAYRLDFVPDGPPAAAPAGEEAPAAAVAAASEAPAAAGQE